MSTPLVSCLLDSPNSLLRTLNRAENKTSDLKLTRWMQLPLKTVASFYWSQCASSDPNFSVTGTLLTVSLSSLDVKHFVEQFYV